MNITVAGAAVAGNVVADNVVIKNGLDLVVVGFGFIGVEGTADQADLFAGESHEDDGLFELVLAHDGGQFHDDRRAAAIVADAGRGGVGRFFVVHGIGRTVAARAEDAAAGFWVDVERIVMAADDEMLFGVCGSGQNGDYVDEFHVAEDAAFVLHFVGIEVDFEAGAIAAE